MNLEERGTINEAFRKLERLRTVKTAREIELEELLQSACEIAKRNGVQTHWRRFVESCHAIKIGGITSRVYGLLEGDLIAGDDGRYK